MPRRKREESEEPEEEAGSDQEQEEEEEEDGEQKEDPCDDALCDGAPAKRCSGALQRPAALTVCTSRRAVCAIQKLT